MRQRRNWNVTSRDGNQRFTSRVDGSDAVKSQAFAETHRMLHQRISTFVKLPLDSLDKLTLQKTLDEMFAEVRKLRAVMPADVKFTREEANER